MLLNHEFFAEGVKIESLPQQGEESEHSNILHLRLEVPIKEPSKHKNNQESIEFMFDIAKDQPEVVVDMMVSLANLIVSPSQFKLVFENLTLFLWQAT